MSWFDQSANESESIKSHIRMCVAVEFDFPSGFVRAWTGTGDLTLTVGASGGNDQNSWSTIDIGMPWRLGAFLPDATAAVSQAEANMGTGLYAGLSGSASSVVFTGVGILGRIEMPSERTDMKGERKSYQLAGVDPSLISESDIDNSFGRSVREWFLFLDTETMQLIDLPELNWEGRIDSIRRVDGAEPVIEVNAEHRLVFLDRADGWLLTHEHQQAFFPGDNGFDQVPAEETKTLVWGGKNISFKKRGKYSNGVTNSK